MTLALLITAVGGAWAQTQWPSGSCTVTLNNGTLTVSGNGGMDEYADPSNRPWDVNSEDITSVVVESGVTSVGMSAFYDFSNLTSVTLPEGLTAINDLAFSDCISLQSITIPSTVTSIGGMAFNNCSAMTSVTLSEGLKTIGDMAFGSCSRLTSVTLPEGLTTIKSMAFSSCSSLTSVTIPSTVTSIGDYAFFLSSAISDVNLYANPGNLTWGDTSMDFKSDKATQCHVLAEHLSTYQTNFSSANVTFVGDLQPLPGTMVLNSDKTTATMTMPANDVTAEYELVRDLAQQTSVNLIIGTGDAATPVTADTRLRIQKDNTYGYLPVSALSCTFSDEIEGNTILPTGFNDAKLTPQFYLQGENEEWTLVTDINTETHLPNNLQPGQVYCMTLKAAEGSNYDGETPKSFTITLFQGYEVTVGAGEYATFYKDEPLYADAMTSAEAELYTITEVNATEAVLSDKIEVVPSETPMLIYNPNEVEKTFLLIPADAEPAVKPTLADQFKGTLEEKNMPASTEGRDYYVCTGNAFVWVKSEGTIAANRCWLEIIAQPAGARANTRSIVSGGDTTNIDATTRDALEGDYYDLQGRKVEKPLRKGVYIKSGKKVIKH